MVELRTVLGLTIVAALLWTIAPALTEFLKDFEQQASKTGIEVFSFNLTVSATNNTFCVVNVTNGLVKNYGAKADNVVAKVYIVNNESRNVKVVDYSIGVLAHDEVKTFEVLDIEFPCTGFFYDGQRLGNVSVIAFAKQPEIADS